jgi:hypothetical protein
MHGTGDEGDGRIARRDEPLGDSGRRDSAWLDEPDDEVARRPRPGLLVVAALPWLLVVALLVLPGRLGGDGPGATEPTGADAPRPDAPVGGTSGAIDAPVGGTSGAIDASGSETPTGSATGAGATDAGGEAAPGGAADPATRGGSATELTGTHTGDGRDPVEAEAAALALVVARGWLTGVAPVLDVAGRPPPIDDRYAEHLVVEGIDRPGPEAAVVRVVAVVLSGGTQLEASIERLAVPVALTPEGPHPAGAPWPLPPPATAPLLPAVDTIDDAEQLLAAREALADTGFDPDLLVGLGATSGWPVIATLSDATTPEVWLVRDGDGFLVAGTEPSPSPGR